MFEKNLFINHNSIKMIARSIGQQDLNTFNTDYLEMVKYATKAPSGHNAQPWKFIISAFSIEIHPDFSKALPVVDHNNRELYISLGCAAENLCIAANKFGYKTTFSIEKDQDEHHFIKIMLFNGPYFDDCQFNQIEKRQTNRSIYKSEMIPNETIQFLEKLTISDSIHMYYYKNGSAEFNVLRELVAKGNSIQMKDRAFKEELLNWIRFNKKQISSLNDGLTYEVMGTPSTPGFIGRLIVKAFLNPEKQNKSDRQKINSSSHLVLFTVDQNNPENWMMVGRSLERFLLETTRLGIASAYLNQPCEVECISVSMQSSLQISNEYPALLLRIGYADPLPYAPRRDIKEVIIFKN
jgi:hypothetical protein